MCQRYDFANASREHSRCTKYIQVRSTVAGQDWRFRTQQTGHRRGHLSRHPSRHGHVQSTRGIGHFQRPRAPALESEGITLIHHRGRHMVSRHHRLPHGHWRTPIPRNNQARALRHSRRRVSRRSARQSWGIAGLHQVCSKRNGSVTHGTASCRSPVLHHVA
jgi:hypothetical protein